MYWKDTHKMPNTLVSSLIPMENINLVISWNPQYRCGEHFVCISTRFTALKPFFLWTGLASFDIRNTRKKWQNDCKKMNGTNREHKNICISSMNLFLIYSVDKSQEYCFHIQLPAAFLTTHCSMFDWHIEFPTHPFPSILSGRSRRL